MKPSYEQIQQRAERARLKLKASGFINTSTLGWFHKDCLDFGLRSGAVTKKGGIYTLLTEVVDKEIITGYRGRSPIVEKKQKLDFSKIKTFFEYCDEWDKQRYQRNYAADEEKKVEKITLDEIRKTLCLS